MTCLDIGIPLSNEKEWAAGNTTSVWVKLKILPVSENTLAAGLCLHTLLESANCLIAIETSVSTGPEGGLPKGAKMFRK